MIFHSYVSLPEGNPLKNMTSSDWIIIPTIEENKKKKHVPNHQPVTQTINIGGTKAITKYATNLQLSSIVHFPCFTRADIAVHTC